MNATPFSGHVQDQWPETVPILKAKTTSHNLASCVHASLQQDTLTVPDTLFRLSASAEPEIHLHAGASPGLTDDHFVELDHVSIRSHGYLMHAKSERAL
jgi:hypothetical protein